MTRSTRITIAYGGSEYFVSGRSLDEVQTEIEAAQSAGEPRWLDVAVGQGRSTPARLLVGPGIPVAIWVVNVDGDPAEREHAPSETPAYDV